VTFLFSSFKKFSHEVKVEFTLSKNFGRSYVVKMFTSTSVTKSASDYPFWRCFEPWAYPGGDIGIYSSRNCLDKA
jgi:uncharacterized protein (DUF1697 family)